MDRTPPATGRPQLRSLVRWLRPDRGLVLLTVVLGGLASAFEVASLGLVGVLLQVTEAGVTGRLGPFSRVVPLLRGLTPTGQRAVLVSLILLGISLRGLAWWASAALREKIGTHVHAKVRHRVLDRLARAPLAWLERRGVGEQDSLILHETERLAHATTDLLQLCVYASMACWYLALLFYLAPRLTFAALGLLVVAGTALRLLRRPVERHARRMREESRGLAGAIHETLSGLHLLKLLGRTDEAVARFDASSEAFLDAKWRQRKALDSIPPVSELLGAVVVLAILWLGSTVLPIRGDADPVQLLPYVLTFYRLLPRFLAIPALRTALAANLSSADVVDAFLADPAAEPDPDGGLAVPAGSHRVALVDVRHRFAPDGPWVLDGTTFELRPGRTTALVGPSGAGKSTIVDLLLGVRRPTQGRVEIDGTSLLALSGDAWRQRVGVVPQEPRLFDRSVRENLRLVAPEATEERLLAALDEADAGFVRRLPEGLDTKLGERGARLSGGERQRLCIARALLMEPSLLVFDEPTSHLDGDSERAVTGALQRAAAGRTVLVIAHRLSTVRAADTILFLRGGRIVEEGSHEALMAQGGEYARLVRLGLDDLESAPPAAAGAAPS